MRRINNAINYRIVLFLYIFFSQVGYLRKVTHVDVMSAIPPINIYACVIIIVIQYCRIFLVFIGYSLRFFFNIILLAYRTDTRIVQ